MAKTDNNYRIKTNIGENTILHVPLKRDIDFLEILSLKVSQKGLYKLHASNYGVVIGRVLANDGFGVPNARISVFVELSEEDRKNTDIVQYYPYTSISTRDKEHRRYNLLPDDKNSDCYRIVGTFPNKRLVLDNDTQIEIFDKYWKYTTVTNSAGDYMIFGVPTGSQNIHVDIDLSNIGILSQKPRDLVYKGYNITSFDNASQFKESTNLDNLVQVIGQDSTVNVYPFWGDKEAEGIVSITRQDINVAYKFETTCVFMGSIASDNNTNSIGHECTPTKKMGFNSGLVASEGTIEMIRKTQDGLVEEVQIQGNQLIDGDGVWCYQIPMNLDYVVTDEYGNIVPTDNPNKGIATRTSVRFRFSVNETGSEGISRHRAEYLVPNNPMPSNNENWEKSSSSQNDRLIVPQFGTWQDFDKFYEFGSATPDECFRDLFWNKVYSVKNYVPRLQSTKSVTTDQYTGIRTTNYHNSISPFPFNNVRFRFPFSYMFLCILMEIFFVMAAIVNSILSFLRIICIGIPGLKILGVKLYWYPFDFIKCITMDIEDDEAGDGSIITYAPGCWGRPPKGAKIGDMDGYTNRMQRGLAQDSEVVNFDFYNDWINGCLYMPLWFWKKTKKKKYFFGLFSKKAVNKFCNASTTTKNLRLAQGCAVSVKKGEGALDKNIHKRRSLLRLPYGVIYEKTNNAGLNLYYYTSATSTSSNRSLNNIPFIRLFATDIILLGSMADCDLDSFPKMFSQLPSTTANIPFMVSTKIATDNDADTQVMLNMTETTPLSVTGMDWGSKEGKSPKKLTNGLLIDLSCTSVTTYHKSIINTRRLCELGVTLDGAYDQITPTKNGLIKYKEIEPDGLITRIEINDLESRAMFATLNHNGLNKLIKSPVTNYNTYKLHYLYPIEFDGQLGESCHNYTNNNTTDNESISYQSFRFGTDGHAKWQYTNNFPMYNNSFYFYFGINPGKTALEKFYTNFYSECFDNYKNPFSYSISTIPGEWCNQNAFARIELNKIRSPYKVEIIDGMGISFIKLDNLEHNIIEIELWDEGDENDNPKFYEKIYEDLKQWAIEKKNKDGVQSEVTDEDIARSYMYWEVPNADGTFFYRVISRNFTNGLYTVKITDAYNKVLTSELDLLQNTLNFDIETNNLSDQYTAGRFVDEESSGKIIIKSLSIDGKEYRFKQDDLTQCKDIGMGVYDIYGYEVVNSNSTDDCLYKLGDTSKKVRISITPKNLLKDNLISNFEDTIFKKDNYFKKYDFISSYECLDGNTDMLVWEIKTSDQFDISAVMFCDYDKEVLSDNIFETTVNIDNSEPMQLLLQDIDTSVIAIPISDDAAIEMWANINDPQYYNFPSCDESNFEWWANNANIINNLKEEGGSLNNEDLVNVVTYKLNSVLNIANAAFCTGSQNVFEFTSKGGSKPTFNSVYPEYSSITTANNRIHKFQSYIYSNSTTTIQTNSNYPTIVNDNYYTLLTDNKSNFKWKYKLNNIFKTDVATNSKLGNYMGLIDMNNTKKTIPSDPNNKMIPWIRPLSYGEVVDENNNSKGFSNNANLSIYMDEQDKIDGELVKNYFLCHSVDKRADYDLYILKNTNSNDSTKGKIVLGKDSKFFGGIALAHDENNNIISNDVNDKTEYYYDKDGNLKLNEKAVETKTYYSLNFRSVGTTNPTQFKFKKDEKDENKEIDTKSITHWKYSNENGMPVFTCKYDLTYERGNLFSWTQTSYSYNTTASVVDGSTVACEAYEGNEVEGDIGTSKYLDTSYPTIREIAANDFYNVDTKINMHQRVTEKCLRYKVSLDENTSHSVYTNAPILIEANDDDNITIDMIKKAYNNGDVRNTSLMIKEDYKDTYQQVFDPTLKTKYVSLTNSPNQRLEDDSELRNVVTYKISNPSQKKVYPVLMREYIDDYFNVSRIARKVTTYEIGKVVDMSKITNNYFYTVMYPWDRQSWYVYPDNGHPTDRPMPIPDVKYNDNKKFYSFVAMSFYGNYLNGKTSMSFNLDSRGDVIDFNPNVFDDIIERDAETSNYMICAKLGNVIYDDVYVLAHKDLNRYQIIIPFYTNASTTVVANEDNEEDVVAVSPDWYKNPSIDVYVKCTDGFVYKFVRRL